MTRVSRKGQVTIPADVRFALGISAGDQIVFSSEQGIGTFRRSDGAIGRAGALARVPRREGSLLERLLVTAEPDAIAKISDARRQHRRMRIPDSHVLDLARRAADAGVDPQAVAAIVRDVTAERAFRFERPRALRAAADAIAAGSDPIDAYLEV